MKKAILFSTTIAMLGMAACNKEYTCDCVESDGMGYTETNNYTDEFKSKAKAESWCADHEEDSSAPIANCNLD